MNRLRPQRVLTSLIVPVLLLAVVPATLADVRLPSVFGSHMVLQRGTAVPVWGWADPGEKVTVSFRDQTKTTTADDAGNWMVKLDSLSVGEPGSLTVSAGNTIELTDVLVGEVWVCSGQSNMQWSVAASRDPDLETAAANRPQLRLFKVPMVTAAEPQKDAQAQWTLCNSETLPGFTAVGYSFGATLNDIIDVPIGLIQTAWGGTRAEAWTSPEAMASTRELKPILDAWDERAAAYNPDRAQQQYKAALKKWEEQAAAAREAGKQPPRRPALQENPRTDRHHPGTLYNAMVAPLVPFAVRGAIWYQGESNASRAYQYRTLMPTMIQSWRDAWGQGDFPFYMVQLANFKAITEHPRDSDWAELREAQWLTEDALPNVGVACITDLGAAKDIHPRDKLNVGRRLARLALVDQYGFEGKIIPRGPTYRSLDLQGSKAIVHFDNYGSPLASWYQEPLTGFAIAGADRKWHWASAKITGPDTVELSHPDVPEPVAVRYNWADNPQGNLYNNHLLPAYPFRTDDWEGITASNVRP